MKKFALVALSALATVAVGTAQAQEVRVLNWSDYIDEDLLEKFTDETGIKITYDVFDSNEVLEAKLLAGNSGYDVVVPSASFLARQIQAGVFQQLDQSALPNSVHLWDEIKAATASSDPGNAYSINYMWGTTGIGVNVGMVAERLGDDYGSSWDLIFDVDKISKLSDCGVHILDAPTEVIPAAMNYLGLDPTSQDPADIEKGGELLESIRPYVTKFHSSEYIDALANGEICLALGWSGDVFIALYEADDADNGVTIEYIVPDEGALMWFDQMAIPTDAGNVEEAHVFLNFIMDPENIAAATNYVYYANGNVTSQPLLDSEVIDDPAIYPPAETQESLYVLQPYPPRVQRVVTRTWTRVVTGS
ncbi:MAG: spermidine/putrescine ABC transporter substrate-binding protein PotF [Geminicoccus sp.]|nr:spermidine/putrescine ABC transporter substrate-binding protein PotF [Geminicoccus sp.]